MATTNVDIVKVSELTSIERLTSNDRFIVNDHNPDDGTVITKTILGTDLAADLGGRITLGDLAGVNLESAVIGNVLKFDGTNWVPAIDNTGGGAGGGIELTDLNAVTLPPVLGQSSTLTYNQYQGIITFTQPDLRISNLDDVVDQVPTTGQFLRWGGSFWYPSAIDEQALLVDNSSVGVGDGSISLEGDVLTFTPPDFTPYLTEETDPIFSQSAAASLTFSTLAQLNELLLPQEDLKLGDLGDVNLTGVTTETGMGIYFDRGTQLWTAQFAKPGKLGDLDDVYTSSAENGDIIIYDGAQWRAQPNPTGSVEAGDGLVGGGAGDVVLHVLPGAGIGIRNDAVTLTADLDQLQNVSVSSAQPGDVLFYYGGNSWLAKRPELLGPQYLNDLLDCSVSNSANGQFLQYQNGSWIPANQADADLDFVREVSAGQGLTGGGRASTVTLNVGAGDGIAVDSSKVSIRTAGGLNFDSNGRLQVQTGTGLTVSSTTNGVVGLDAVLNDLNNVGGTPGDGQVLTWDNAQGRWEPRTVTSGGGGGETTSAGFGISKNASARIAIARETDNIQGFEGSSDGNGGILRLMRPANGQALKWTGSQWQGFTPSDVTAGPGITIADGKVSITEITTNQQGLEFSSNGDDGSNVRLMRPDAGEALKWTGSKWVGYDPTPTGSLEPGFGINFLEGRVKVSLFSAVKQGIEESDDTDEGYTTGDIQLMRPAAGQALKWTGSKWVGFTPVTEAGGGSLGIINKDTGGSTHYLTFTDTPGDDTITNVFESGNLTFKPGASTLTIGGGGTGGTGVLQVVNDNDDGVRAYSGGRLEITDISGLPQITFRDDYDGTIRHDFRLRQAGDKFQLHSETKQIISATNDKVTIGTNCEDPTTLDVKGEIKFCGKLVEAGLEQFPIQGVRMWCKIRRTPPQNGDNSEGYSIEASSLDNNGNPHITSLTDTNGYGRVRLNFRYNLNGVQDGWGRTIGNNYVVNVTGLDAEGDHMFGVIECSSDAVEVYSKDVEDFDDAGGSTSGKDMVSNFFISIVF